MRHRSRVRATVWIAGLALAAVVALAIAKQDQLAVRYHLFRLRDEPQLLARLCEASEKSPEGRAARAFLKEPAGARELVRWLLEGLELESQDWMSSFSAERDPPPGQEETLYHVDRACLAKTQATQFGTPVDRLVIVMDWAWEATGLLTRDVPTSSNPSAYEFLDKVARIELELPDFPGLRFKAAPAEEARTLFAESRSDGDLSFLSGKNRFVLLAYKPGKLVPPRRRPTNLFPPLPTWLKKL